MLLNAKKHTHKKTLIQKIALEVLLLPLQYIAFFRAYYYLVTLKKALAALFESNAGL